jgi:hypothetical protein
MSLVGLVKWRLWRILMLLKRRPIWRSAICCSSATRTLSMWPTRMGTPLYIWQQKEGMSISWTAFAPWSRRQESRQSAPTPRARRHCTLPLVEAMPTLSSFFSAKAARHQVSMPKGNRRCTMLAANRCARSLLSYSFASDLNTSLRISGGANPRGGG